MNQPDDKARQAMIENGFINATPEQIILWNSAFNYFRPTGIQPIAFVGEFAIGQGNFGFETVAPASQLFVCLEIQVSAYNPIAPSWIDFNVPNDFQYPTSTITFGFTLGGAERFLDPYTVPPNLIDFADLNRSAKNFMFSFYAQGFFRFIRFIGFKFTR
jgi:hypothetical protein